jgi:serine/threonine protein kinase
LKSAKKRNDLKVNKVSDVDSLDEEIELLLSTKKLKQKQCLINVNKNIIIINLILSNSGIDLYTFIKKKHDFGKQISILKNDFKYAVYFLLEGLQLLHKHEITHKDIKPHNVCISFVNNRPHIKYIDFGLSEHIKYLGHSYSNIFNSGTPCYMAPDFVLLVEMKRNSFSDLLLDKRLTNYIIKKIYLSIKSNLSTFTNKGLNKSYLNGNNDTTFGMTNDKIYRKNNYFVSENDIKVIFTFLIKLYQENELLDYYFMKYDGINPKLDIFSLGLTIFEMKEELGVKDILLTNLIKNMLELNSINRININKCCNHLYFS